ncbi:ABC transporter ATP-binding protein [Streptomyces sp. TLI_171]|uniref:ABC transporter ATP-binding protein n=1 Tax=Streptomyces sp. TLI_171 TaxID=1938859 RepID=UPI000C19F66D|nr:ABC transporter ATP-binding protein [Streptomyces sp. TLI_171]RKE20741.1 ABC-2 type transport system ATP-binding protein [Streptomyces sp. TLI_171]
MTPLSENSPAVEVTGLRRSYGDYEAVRGISFSIARGELFALLGTNGAGKTTTLEVLEGHHPPTSGSVRVLGGLDPFTAGPQVRRRTGAMLQEGGFFKELTVKETVDCWRTFTSRARPTAEVLARVGLEPKAGTRVGQLSGGERRRIDLALAVLNDPELLFLDEPTTGMDPEARRATWRLVKELRAAGTTVVLTTHYLEEAQQLADRVAIMDRGVIAAAGTVGEVLSGRGDLITLPLPPGRPLAALPELLGSAPSLADGRAVYRVPRSAPALAALHSWAAAHDVELDGLEVRSSSLEDVFLDLAAHHPVPEGASR